jgi:hypothetical protein
VRVQRVGGITSTTVQGALQALDTGKQPAGSYLAGVGTARLPAAAASVPILTTDIEVGFDSATAATAVPLPSVAAWAAANPNGLELAGFDLTGHAATHNITPSLNGTDVFTQGVVPAIKSNFGSFRLRPIIIPGGPDQWFVRSVG